MSAQQTKIVFALFVLVALCWLGSPLLAEREEEIPQVPAFTSTFDAAEAFEVAQGFVTQHPMRVLGSLEARQSTGYLRDALTQAGYEVTFAHFEAVVENRHEVGRNVLGFRQGDDGIVAVIAHYDTAPTTFQGAMDNGAAVGVMLELARVLSATVRHSLLFIASDGEEWGMLGALDFARTYERRQELVAVLSLDGVACGELSGLRLETVGQGGGYSPPWLRQIARRAARSEGLPVAEPVGIREHLERAIPISATDQGPLLNAGIAAINLGSASRDAELRREIYHSESDTMDKIELASMGRYGRAAERILRHIDALPGIPQQSMGAFRLAEGRLMPPAGVTMLHYLTFLPLLAVFVFHWKNHEQQLGIEHIQREVTCFTATLSPFLLSYGCVLLLMHFGHIPQYSLYPPPPGDPVLENPNWRVVATVLSVWIFSGVLLFLLGRFVTGRLPRPDFYVSKLLLLFLLLVVIALALQYNSYWAVTFLALPAFIWGLVSPGKEAGQRAANSLWIFGGGMVFYAVVWMYGSALGLGPGLCWYSILGLSTGMFSRNGFLLAAAAAALGMRFLAAQFHAEED